MPDFKAFITSQVNMEESDLEVVFSKFRFQTFAKGQLLFKRGQVVSQYYYLQSGALRFIHGENLDLTAWVVLPDEFFTDISSYHPQQPTRFNAAFIETAGIYCIEKSDMEMLYQQFPAWQAFGRKIWEAIAIRMIDEIIRFQTLSVEERYLEFLQKPDFMQHVSIKQLASYLGITPNALSRIRKKIR